MATILYLHNNTIVGILIKKYKQNYQAFWVGKN